MCLVIHAMELLLLACACVLTSASAAVSTDFNTSKFIQVIRRGRSSIHYTPPVFYYNVVFGDKNIKYAVMRCLVDYPDNCEVFQQDDAKCCNYILVYMEYVFLAKRDGIARCESHRKQSCDYIHKTDAQVLSLTAGGEHLFAGLEDGSILRCTLQQPYSCRVLHTFRNKQVWSVTLMGNFLYAGLGNGQLMRCSLTAENSCTLRHAMGMGITGLTVTGNTISVSVWFKGLSTCFGEPSVGYCVSGANNILYPRAIASFNGSLYLIEQLANNGMYSCSPPVNPTCRHFGRHKTYLGIAFAYGTFHMQGYYKNEDTACSQQPDLLSPPCVPYYDVQQRSKLEVHVQNGRLHNSDGCLVDTGEQSRPWIFVMGPDGRILLTSNEQEWLYTSSLLAGNPVSGAGQIVVENGVIKKIIACSAHYLPDLALNKQVVDSLRAQGYIDSHEPIVLEKGCECDTCQGAQPHQAATP